MASNSFGTAFGAFIDIESQPARISGPPAVAQKPVTTPTAIELDEYTWGARYNGPERPYPISSDQHSAPQTPYTGPQTPYTGAQTPADFLASHPPTPRRDEAAELVQSFFYPSMNKYRVLTASLIYLGNGLTDSAAGALIPYMEKDYKIGYATVSLIFVTQAVGFIVSAFFMDTIQSLLGRGKSLMFAEVMLIAANVTLVTTPPFGAVVFAYLLFGCGMALNIAMNNVFLSNLANSTVMLGIAHGSYGVGGTLGPIIATSFVSTGQIWSRYYFLTLGIRLICLVVAGYVFRGYEREGPARLQSALERTASRRVAQEAGEPSNIQLLIQALKNRTTLMGALFIFAYQGAEVSISGWVISFLISYRHGDPSQVGYVTAGFWGGITIGRFVLTHFCHRIGERLAVYLLGVGAIAFQLLLWFIPNVIGDAVAVSIVGLLLGPVYPSGQTVFAKLLPRHIQMTSISFIGGAGSSGGAVAPFLTGLLAQAVGTWVLHPICIGLFIIMMGCWFCLPIVEKRDE